MAASYFSMRASVWSSSMPELAEDSSLAQMMAPVELSASFVPVTFIKAASNKSAASRPLTKPWRGSKPG